LTLQRRGMSGSAIRFFSTREAYGKFSNFAPFPISIEGRVWPTVEYYFQAQKFVGTKYEEAIRVTRSAMIAAKMGRDRKKPLRKDWESVRDAIMLEAIQAKFTQHPVLGSLLLSTGNTELIEHTEKDRYWGDGGDGRGGNRLGQILMQIRLELASR
jgi:N-glycosidase YbiA